MSSPIEKIPTGVPGLDIITFGGLPKGRTTLVTGRSGTAKSILALQIATNFAKGGVKTLLMAIEDAPDDLITTGDSLGFGMTELTKSGMVRIMDLTPPMEGPIIVTGDYDLSGLIHRIHAAVRESNVEAIVLDSATALFSPRPPDALIRSHFFHLVHTFRRLNLTGIITAEADGDYGPLTTLGVEEFVCDLVLILRNLVDGERRRRSVEVHKYRRSNHYKGEYPCTITTKGVTVFPLDAREPALFQAERYPSGLVGLDAMTAGGWLRDSIVLVRGPAGSGKTTLAGMYARAGAARGERVMYYGFEETKPILMRNFAAIGLDLEELEKKGHLRIACRYPEATSPEDMLVDLRTGLDEYKPSLVVLDSVSSIEHSTSSRGFRQFMVGVAALLREHGRSALLTQTIVHGSDKDIAAPYLSTIPDAILQLDYDLAEHSLERSIRVLKMRGSAHATDRRRLNIEPGGLRVEATSSTSKGS